MREKIATSVAAAAYPCTSLLSEVICETVLLDGKPRAHGIHIHDSNSCSLDGIRKRLWNPTNTIHGAPNVRRSHFGDLRNILAVPDRSGTMSSSSGHRSQRVGMKSLGRSSCIRTGTIFVHNQTEIRGRPCGEIRKTRKVVGSWK